MFRANIRRAAHEKLFQFSLKGPRDKRIGPKPVIMSISTIRTNGFRAAGDLSFIFLHRIENSIFIYVSSGNKTAFLRLEIVFLIDTVNTFRAQIPFV